MFAIENIDRMTKVKISIGSPIVKSPGNVEVSFLVLTEEGV